MNHLFGRHFRLSIPHSGNPAQIGDVRNRNAVLARSAIDKLKVLATLKDVTVVFRDVEAAAACVVSALESCGAGVHRAFYTKSSGNITPPPKSRNYLNVIQNRSCYLGYISGVESLIMIII